MSRISRAADDSLHPWLRIEPELAVESICAKFRDAVMTELMRKGAVVAVSGGIDSSVTATLAVRALTRERVLGLLLPERDSSASSTTMGELLCRHLGIVYETTDITRTLEEIGCYRWRDDAIRTVFPGYGPGWRSKVVISPNLESPTRFNFFKLVVESPDGKRLEKRLPYRAYLQIVAATNFKQRIRKTLEYFHADRLNFAVAGTPNRLEYDQGFFVKNGDGSADIKPIAHLYKSQVYALARHLQLPEAICSAAPTTDTYNLEQGQDEFYFVLPYATMDLLLCGMNLGKEIGDIARETGLTEMHVTRAVHDIRTKRKTTRPLHMKPILVGAVPEVAG